jgi:hypothetical protein
MVRNLGAAFNNIDLAVSFGFAGNALEPIHPYQTVQSVRISLSNYSSVPDVVSTGVPKIH